MKKILVILLLLIGAASLALSQTNEVQTTPDVMASERIIDGKVLKDTQEILRDLHLNLEQLNLGQLQQQIEQELERVNASLPEIKEIIEGVLGQQEEIRQQIEDVRATLPEINSILQGVQEAITEALKDLKVDSAQ